MAGEKGSTGGLSLDRALMEARGAGVVSGRFGWEGLGRVAWKMEGWRGGSMCEESQGDAGK